MHVDSIMLHRILKSSRDEQCRLLREVGFDLMNDADEFLEKRISPELWEHPEEDTIINFFQKTLMDAEGRIEEYQNGADLTIEERANLQDHLMAEAMENEYHPGIFCGELTDGQRKLVVLTERTGGGFDCEATLVGVFKTQQEGLQEIGGVSVTY